MGFDLLLRNGYQVSAWFMEGGQVAAKIRVDSYASPDWKILDMRDLDGDGRDDILFERPSGTLYTWLMDGFQVREKGDIESPGPGESAVIPR